MEEPSADSRSSRSRKVAGPAVAVRPAVPAGTTGGGGDGGPGGVVVSGRVLSSEDLSRAVFGGTAQVGGVLQLAGCKRVGPVPGGWGLLGRGAARTHEGLGC